MNVQLCDMCGILCMCACIGEDERKRELRECAPQKKEMRELPNYLA